MSDEQFVVVVIIASGIITCLIGLIGVYGDKWFSRKPAEPVYTVIGCRIFVSLLQDGDKWWAREGGRYSAHDRVHHSNSHVAINVTKSLFDHYQISMSGEVLYPKYLTKDDYRRIIEAAKDVYKEAKRRQHLKQTSQITRGLEQK